MERAAGQTVPVAIPTELTRRLAAVCQQIQWVVVGTNAPADLLAWLNVLQRDEAAILDTAPAGCWLTSCATCCSCTSPVT